MVIFFTDCFMKTCGEAYICLLSQVQCERCTGRLFPLGPDSLDRVQ